MLTICNIDDVILKNDLESSHSTVKIFSTTSKNIILTDEINPHHIFKFDNSKYGLFIGTPIYKGVSFNQIIEQVTSDFWKNKLDIDSLMGNFVFVFWNENHIYILGDQIGNQVLFHDEKTNRFSSSFLNLILNGKSKYKINRDALHEKLSTGFNIGKDTLVKEIIKVNRLFDNRKNKEEITFLFHNQISLNKIDFHHEGRRKSIQKQSSLLDEYFQIINSTFKNESGDLGLSSGLDCRLILSLAKKHFDNKLNIHSHFTEGVHENEIHVAEKLVKEYGTEINLVKTSKMDRLKNDEVESILSDNFSFFDGNSARHLGAFSETYTSDYRKKCMGNATFSLNGLGGEVFRDSYFTGSRVINWNNWADRYLFFPFSKESVGNQNTLNQTRDYIFDKLNQEMEFHPDKMDILTTHKYYSFIKMPQCNGSVVRSYGKVSPIVFPFIEPKITTEAIKAIPYLGTGLNYQAQLITAIDPKLAKIGSHYGFGFDKIPLKYYLWSKLKENGSVKKRNELVKQKLNRKKDSQSYIDFLDFLNETDVLKQSKEILLSYSPNTNFDDLMLESTQRRYTIFLAYSLKKLSNHIEA